LDLSVQGCSGVGVVAVVVQEGIQGEEPRIARLVLVARSLDPRGDLVVTARAAPDLERSLRGLGHSVDRLVASVVFAALLLAGTLLVLNGERPIGLAAMGLGLLTLVLVLLRAR